MKHRCLNMIELYPDSAKVLAALAKYGEKEVSYALLQTRLSFDLEPELITFLVENSYIEKNEQAGQDYLMLSPKGRSFLQCKMDLVE